MKVKTYTGRSLPELLEQARGELGPQAVLLSTERMRERGWRGWIRPPLTRITMALEDPVDDGPVRREVASLRRVVEHLSTRIPERTPEAPPAWQEIRDRLSDTGVCDATIAGLQEVLEIGAQETAHELRSRTQRRLEAALGLPHPIRLQPYKTLKVALVGPTGVGKTTTLAKLAARYALGEGAKVALVTADTYRIAAVEQLRTYAELLGVEIETAQTPAEIHRAVEKHQDKELILVDTGGRSHRNAVQLGELRAYLGALAPDETHLVMSLATARREALAIAEAFGRVGFNRTIVTKSDEAEGPGLLLELALAGRGPFSYITMGQRVPEDLEVFNPRTLVKSILGEVS